MEELKQLIKEDKQIMGVLDSHIQDLQKLLADFQSIKGLFTDFFQRQDSFMEKMEKFIEVRE